MLTGLERAAQFIAEDVEPAGAVVVVEGVAGAHLFDVRGGVEAVAFNGGGAVQAAHGLADAGLATASNTHDDQGSNRLTHETPQDADSATFARCKASAKTGFSRAVLSFFGSDACIHSNRLTQNLTGSGNPTFKHLQPFGDSATLVPRFLFGKPPDDL